MPIVEHEFKHRSPSRCYRTGLEAALAVAGSAVPRSVAGQWPLSLQAFGEMGPEAFGFSAKPIGLWPLPIGMAGKTIVFSEKTFGNAQEPFAFGQKQKDFGKRHEEMLERQ